MNFFSKKNIVWIVSTFLVFPILCGCNKEPVFMEADAYEHVIAMSETIVPEEKESVDLTPENQEEMTDGVLKKEGNTSDATERIMVHVCGAVVCPGVYELASDSRVVDGISRAGGFLPQAASDYVNQAAFVFDGDKIWIPTVEEAEALLKEGDGGSYITLLESKNGIGKNTSSDSPAKININTADKELLCTLPGIGSTRADSIISYREKNGHFSSIEDIMKVSGIKDNSFQKIKEYISVK